MICPKCEKETVLRKENKTWKYIVLPGLYWLYVMQKDPHHCIHCGARIGR